MYSFICLFSFGCTGSSLLYSGFLQLWQVGATPRRGVQAAHCGGFPCCRAQVLGLEASAAAVRGLSSCGSRVLECRLGSCKARAQLLHSMRNLPRPGIEPVSPELAVDYYPLCCQGSPRYVHFLKHNATAYFTDYSVNITFIHIGKPKKTSFHMNSL